MQAWIGATALRKVDGYAPALDVLARYATDPQQAAPRWGRLWETCWRAHGSGAPWRPDDAAGDDWRDVPALGAWDDWGVPQLVNFNGMVWSQHGHAERGAGQTAGDAGAGAGGRTRPDLGQRPGGG